MADPSQSGTSTGPPEGRPRRGGIPVLENALWAARFTALIAVAGSLVAALGMLYVATMDAVYLVTHLRSYADTALSIADRKVLHKDTLLHVVEVVDGYLLATILLIFAFGLFELFISPLDGAKASRSGAAVLVIHDLDELKGRLGKVVLLIMIVKFFEDVLTVDSQRPLDLLLLAGGIALVAAALWLSKADSKGHGAATS